MSLRIGLIASLVILYLAGVQLHAMHAPLWAPALLIGLVFLALVAAMYLRVLPALLALPLLAIAMAGIAGMEWRDIFSSVVQDGSIKLAKWIAAAIMGAILAEVIKKTGIAQTAIKKTAELGGDRPIVLTVLLTLVIAVLFTTLTGLGSVIMVATIVLPILMSLGLRPIYVGCLFLLAMSLGGIFNLVNWEGYIDVLKMQPSDIMRFALPFAAMMLIAVLAFLIIEGKRLGKARYKAEISETETTHPFVPWYALLTPIVPLVPVLFFAIWNQTHPIPKVRVLEPDDKAVVAVRLSHEAAGAIISDTIYVGKSANYPAGSYKVSVQPEIDKQAKDAVQLPVRFDGQRDGNTSIDIAQSSSGGKLTLTAKLPAGADDLDAVPAMDSGLGKLPASKAAPTPAGRSPLALNLNPGMNTNIAITQQDGASRLTVATESQAIELSPKKTMVLSVLKDNISGAYYVKSEEKDAFEFPIVVAMLLGIIYGVIATWKRGESTVQLVTKSAFDGVAAVGPALVLLIGIGMVYNATTSPAVSSIISPILAKIVPHASGGALAMVHYVLLFTILAPLALYRGPLNLYGMGAGLMGALSPLMPPAALMGAFMSTGMIQGASDPTNTHNVWIANYTNTDVQDILKRTLPYMWIVTFAGLALAAVLSYGGFLK